MVGPTDSATPGSSSGEVPIERAPAASPRPADLSPLAALLREPESSGVDAGEMTPEGASASSPPATTPPVASRERRGRAPWMFALAIGALAVILGSVGAVLVSRDHADGPCELGVRWRQRAAAWPDGTALRTDRRAGIVEGGALIAFQSRDEATAMGHVDDFVEIAGAEFDAIDRVPRERMLFRERTVLGVGGRYYYSGGGAIFEVGDPESLAPLGIDLASAVEIPVDGLRHAGRVPPSGTLLRIAGEDQAWVVANGKRHGAGRACDRARVVVLPRDRRVLDAIPIDARQSGR